MAGSSEAGSPRVLRLAVLTCAALAFCWAFPPFRIVRLERPPAGATAGAPAAGAPTAAAGTPAPAAPATEVFDPVARATALWQTDLLPAVPRATELTTLLPALRVNAEAARTKFGRAAGVGAHYYFVRGSGKVVARERSVLRVAVDGTDEVVALRIGPVFGNTVRDGTGLLDVNAFPGLQEFNALSAALNALVEKTVQPALRDQAAEGARVRFAGCAEAPESSPEAGEPALMIVPLQAEVP